jgi:transcriptional regulator with XRE-family HTH domain
MAKTTYTHFSAWLRDQLREQRLSPREFGERGGVNAATVRRWTGGLRLPSTPHVVERIATTLNVTPDLVRSVLERDVPVAGPRPVVLGRATAPGLPASVPEDRPFAAWLRAALAARDWTTDTLARQLDLDVITTRAWAKGLRTPAGYQVPRIADALGVAVETIHEILAR